MRKLISISATALLLLVLASCEKDEFGDIMEQEIREQSRISGDMIDQNDQGTIDTKEKVKLDRFVRPNHTGVVKEVSDGDEESDDDDNA